MSCPVSIILVNGMPFQKDFRSLQQAWAWLDRMLERHLIDRDNYEKASGQIESVWFLTLMTTSPLIHS